MLIQINYRLNFSGSHCQRYDEVYYDEKLRKTT